MRPSISAWCWCGALALTVFAWPLCLPIPLLDPDEGLHAAISQEMVERGDYVTPRFLGEPFFDKPVLFFWLQAASLNVFGMHSAAIRLPGLWCGLLGAGTTALLAARLFGARAAWLTALLSLSTVLPIALAQAAVHDVALVPWTNLALFCYVAALAANSPRRELAWHLGAGVFLGLAILTKGLIGVAVIGVAYVTYLVASRGLTVRRVALGAVSLLVAGLTAAPWYVAMESANPGYAHYYFVERHLLGYVTETQIHGKQPWWYYLPLLAGGGLPWIAYLPAAWRDWRRDSRETPCAAVRPRLLLWCWLIAGVVFLSLANSKLVTYILPVFPALSILVADLWNRVGSGGGHVARDREVRWTMIGCCAAATLLLPATLLIASHELDLRFGVPIWILTGLLSLATFAPWWAAQRWRPVAAIPVASAVLAGVFMLLMSSIVPRVAERFTAEPLAEHFNAAGEVPERVVLVEERLGSLVFYLDAPLRRGLTAERFPRVGLDRVFSVAPQSHGAVVVPMKLFAQVDQDPRFRGHEFDCVGKYRVYAAAALSPSDAPVMVDQTSRRQRR